MEFTNSFSVKAPRDQVWAVLLDAEQVTPCVPGAQITEAVDATHFKGLVKVKLGAVQMSYRGELEMEPDAGTHTIVLRGKGTETRGSGGASGTVTTRVEETEPGVTTVEMHSQIDVTGRVAQFGRGIMQDVANRLAKEFASCLEAKLAGSTDTAQQDSSASALPPAEETTAPAAQAPGRAGTDAPSEPAAVASPGPPAAGLNPAQPAPQPVPSSQPATPSEIKALPLIMAVARSRLAALLRFLAQKVEPE